MPAGVTTSVNPQLVVATRDEVSKQVADRIKSYTPEWINRRPDDAGIALAHLFSEEMEPVLQRLNQLPDKSFVEFLRTAGVRPFPPTAAEALLQFTVSDRATQSIYVAQGFQVGAAPAQGGDTVIFETSNDLYAAPGTIQEMYALESGLYRAIDPKKDDAPFQPFGRKPRPGAAFFIGISASPGVVLGPQISLGIQVQSPAGQPPPVSTGGVIPPPLPLAPLLRWDALDGTNYQQLEALTDETGGLLRSGIVTLALPAQWRPSIPQGADDTNSLLWLRVQIVYGAYAQAPVLTSVKLNMVRATAVQTFYNEALNPVPGTGGSVMSLSHTPVLPGSLFLVVDDTTDLSFTAGGSAGTRQGQSGAASSALRRWQEVDDLFAFGPDDEVYVLDPVSGEVSFGDGVHGKAVPQGLRNVVALSYAVGGGSAGAVDKGKVSSPVNSVPFISGVTNPAPATGGMDGETQDKAKRRGPGEIRARGRAVAVADYESLALHAPGAQVARAYAVSGFHPVFPGIPIPGVVCVFVVPLKRGLGPPSPDEETLRALSVYLSGQVAPAGVEVVAAAPLYHRVRVETTLVIEPAVSRGNAVRDVLKLIDSYLDPVTGGDDGRGWPFGGTLSSVPLIRKLLTDVPSVTAAPRLNFVVDGVRGAICADVAISANSLVWPAEHGVIAVGSGETS
jgi:predicted phage baseplate assembly protein